MATQFETAAAPLLLTNGAGTAHDIAEEPKHAAATAWQLVDQAITLRSPDAKFWWERSGRMFSRLLEAANYPPALQIGELTFYALFVAPELGPAPGKDGQVRPWQSPATPDGTPIDFSWEWSARGTVRYAFEPIGPDAGTPLDPLNRHAASRWVAKLQEYRLVPGLDMQWYRHFADQMLPQNDAPRLKTADGFIEETTPLAGCFVARDLEPMGPVVKTYLYPGLKAVELGLSNVQLVAQAVRSLPQYHKLLDAEPLLEFLVEATEKYGLWTGLVGVDCLDPSVARIKIYIRAPYTSREYLMDCLTLGGRVPVPAGNEGALADLCAFWDTFLGGSPEVLSADMPRRACPGFYYTLGCGRAVTSKLYISPLSFCSSDADFLARLRCFFKDRLPDQVDSMDSYEKAAEDVYGAHNLHERSDGHYYIGCAMHKNKLRVVSYMAPQILWREREAIRVRKIRDRKTRGPERYGGRKGDN